MTVIVIFSYLALVLLIGVASNRLFRGTGEDYFVASRTIGPFFLLMSLFGTNMTAFAIIGASGEAYHDGIGVFTLVASSSALIIPAVFFFVGTRVWALGKKYGYLTPVQFFRDRWGSDGLGLLLFIVVNALLIPYLLIGVLGGGITINQITQGQIPAWAGAALVCGVVLLYVYLGGMRGTAWVNTFQTVVFMILGGVTFYVVVSQLGGLETAMGTIAASNPDLLVRGHHIQPIQLLTYTCIPLSVGMFPHMFMHWLTAQRAESFRYPLIFYPMCIAVVWAPSVLLGVLGNIDFPGLNGPASNTVILRLITEHAPTFLAGLLGAGVFAAIMSSLDSQSLSIGSMFTNDIVKHYGFHDKMSDKQVVLYGRIFVVGILVVTFILSQISNPSVFALSVWSFSGFAALFPVVFAALFWKRSTKYGAFASVITVSVLWLTFFIQSGGDRTYKLTENGVMPVAAMLVASAIAMIVGSLLTQPPEKERIAKFFPKEKELSSTS